MLATTTSKSRIPQHDPRPKELGFHRYPALYGWNNHMNTTNAASQDPVLLAILQRQLDHITLQMGTVIMRTARSPIFSQSHDFSCFMSNAKGETVAQADGLPIHSGGGGFAVRAVLRDFEGRIEEDDVFILSDPYVAGGNHLPDWTVIAAGTFLFLLPVAIFSFALRGHLLLGVNFGAIRK